MTKIEALSKYLGIKEEELKRRYTDDIFEFGEKEYLVVTDEKANIKVKEYIMNSIWTFNASFIAEHTKRGYTPNLEKSIKAIQEKCDDANDAIFAMIEDIDDFIEDAISADGRGYFLSSYDGEENEEGHYYIYRTN